MGPVVHAYYSAAPAVGYSAYRPQIVHKYISAPPKARGPQSNIAPLLAVQPISASYDLAYDDTGFESYSWADYNAYVDDYAAIASTTVRNIVVRTTTTTTTTSQPETCQLTLYSKTYNLGEELVLLDDSP